MLASDFNGQEDSDPVQLYILPQSPILNFRIPGSLTRSPSQVLVPSPEFGSTVCQGMAGLEKNPHISMILISGNTFMSFVITICTCYNAVTM